MQNVRHERIRELLKRELGEIVRREFPIPMAGLITVNEVGISKNLKSAVVYVGIVGSPEQQRRGFQMLQADRVRIQSMIGKAITLRDTPKLKFIRDESIERGNRVLAILSEIEDSPSQE